MDSKSNCNNCSGYNLVGLAASLAVVISEQFDADDLAVIDDFESFCNHLYETYNVYIGVIHEIEDFE